VDYLTERAVVTNIKQLGPAGVSQRRWTARQVFVHLHKDDIRLACDELAGTTERQKPSWLSKYQLATKQLYDALEEEDVEELRQKADEWNRYGPSEDIQLEYAHICDFSTLLLTPASGCLGSMLLAMWTVSLRACTRVTVPVSS
jgi:hypothetical protein